MNSSPMPEKKLVAQQFSIRLGNQLNDLESLSAWLETITAEAGLSPSLCFKLNLILEEAVVNVIHHGFTSHQDDAYVEVLMSFDARWVDLEVKDNGVPFNPLEDYEVLLPQNLQDANIGGLGIHLIKSYTDNIDYQRTESTNILKMRLSNQA